MLGQFVPERVTQDDNVVLTIAITFVEISPQADLLEKAGSRTAPNWIRRNPICGAEKNSAGEDSPEALNEPAVMRAVARQSQILKDLRAGFEANLAPVFAN